MDFISKWLTIRWKQKYLAQRYERDEVISKLVQLLLSSALQQNASCIVFGEPVEPHPPLDRSRLSPPELDPEIMALKKEADLLAGSSAKDSFNDSPPAMIPIWMRINGTWFQSESIPLRLLHSVIFHIEGLCETEKLGIEVDDVTGKMIRLEVSIRCEPNFNYVIDLKHK